MTLRVGDKEYDHQAVQAAAVPTAESIAACFREDGRCIGQTWKLTKRGWHGCIHKGCDAELDYWIDYADGNRPFQRVGLCEKHKGDVDQMNWSMMRKRIDNARYNRLVLADRSGDEERYHRLLDTFRAVPIEEVIGPEPWD